MSSFIEVIMNIYDMCEVLRDRKDKEIEEVEREIGHLTAKLVKLIEERDDLDHAMLQEDYREYP